MLGLSRRHYERRRSVAPERGHDAATPADISRRDWKAILWRVWEEQAKDNIGIVASGVAYYALLSLFPAIAALVSIYGLVADPVGVEAQFDQLAGLLPPDALQALRDQARSVAMAPDKGLSAGVVFGLLLTLWSASRGVNALLTALNIAYEETEKRGFMTLAMLSMGLTLGGIVFLLLTLAMVVAVPAALAVLPLGSLAAWLALLRWPILAMALMVGLAVIYRYGPSRHQARWRWVSWGAAVAVALWMLGSIGFSVYVANFAGYNETYGSVGAAVVLLLWLNLSSYAVLLGAELNAEMEHQTSRDTTTGPEKPLGRRGATMADTVAWSHIDEKTS